MMHDTYNVKPTYMVAGNTRLPLICPEHVPALPSHHKFLDSGPERPKHAVNILKVVGLSQKQCTQLVLILMTDYGCTYMVEK